MYYNRVQSEFIAVDLWNLIVSLTLLVAFVFFPFVNLGTRVLGAQILSVQQTGIDMLSLLSNSDRAEAFSAALNLNASTDALLILTAGIGVLGMIAALTALVALLVREDSFSQRAATVVFLCGVLLLICLLGWFVSLAPLGMMDLVVRVDLGFWLIALASLGLLLQVAWVLRGGPRLVASGQPQQNPTPRPPTQPARPQPNQNFNYEFGLHVRGQNGYPIAAGHRAPAGARSPQPQQAPSPPPRSGQPTNAWLVEIGSNRTHQLWTGETRLGRSVNSHIRLKSETVSRNAAVVQQQGQHFYIYEVGGKTIYVNGQQVRGKMVLNPNDVIKLSNIHLRFVR